MTNKKNEIQIVKNDILQTIFCNYGNYEVPSYSELIDAGEFIPNWQLSEDYEDYSYESLKNKIDELCENFFTTLEVLNSHKEQKIKLNIDELACSLVLMMKETKNWKAILKDSEYAAYRRIRNNFNFFKFKKVSSIDDARNMLLEHCHALN